MQLGFELGFWHNTVCGSPLQPRVLGYLIYPCGLILGATKGLVSLSAFYVSLRICFDPSWCKLGLPCSQVQPLEAPGRGHLTKEGFGPVLIRLFL